MKNESGKRIVEQIINIERLEQIAGLFGSFDENIKYLEERYNVRVTSRDGEVKVCGEADGVGKASRVIGGLLMLINKGEMLNEQNIRYVMGLIEDGEDETSPT